MSRGIATQFSFILGNCTVRTKIDIITWGMTLSNPVLYMYYSTYLSVPTRLITDGSKDSVFVSDI